jgi:ribosomal protein S18 acetylase RimI-like enzyme
VIEIREFDERGRELLEQRLPSSHQRDRAAAHASGIATFLLAWEDAVPLGYLLIKWSGADEEIVHRLIGHSVELNAITVAAEHRSGGIGSALIDAAERRVRARGYSRVGLAVGLTNIRAARLYERLGYQTWDHGTFDVTWSEGRRTERETCVYMLKLLD